MTNTIWKVDVYVASGPRIPFFGYLELADNYEDTKGHCPQKYIAQL